MTVWREILIAEAAGKTRDEIAEITGATRTYIRSVLSKARHGKLSLNEDDSQGCKATLAADRIATTGSGKSMLDGDFSGLTYERLRSIPGNVIELPFGTKVSVTDAEARAAGIVAFVERPASDEVAPNAPIFGEGPHQVGDEVMIGGATFRCKRVASDEHDLSEFEMVYPTVWQRVARFFGFGRAA